MSYFRGKVCLITGAASGIGLGLAEYIARDGAKVIMTDINQPQLEQESNRLLAEKLDVSTATVDVTSYDEVQAAVDQVVNDHGRLDIMFNNAGIALIGSGIDYSLSDWDTILDVNLKSVIYGVKAAYPVMRRQGSGQIVNTASLAGLLPVVGAIPYSTTKHAVVGLTKGLRGEAAYFGIKVNALCPSFVRTNIVKQALYINTTPDPSEKSIQQMGGYIAMEKFLPEAIDGIVKNKSLIVVPRSARKFWRLYRLIPEKVINLQRRRGKGIERSRANPDFIPKD